MSKELVEVLDNDLEELEKKLLISGRRETELLAKIDRLRRRVESLRGMLHTNAGWWYELSDDDKGDACMEAAGDMESSSNA